MLNLNSILYHPVWIILYLYFTFKCLADSCILKNSKHILKNNIHLHVTFLFLLHLTRIWGGSRPRLKPEVALYLHFAQYQHLRTEARHLKIGWRGWRDLEGNAWLSQKVSGESQLCHCNEPWSGKFVQFSSEKEDSKNTEAKQGFFSVLLRNHPFGPAPAEPPSIIHAHQYRTLAPSSLAELELSRMELVSSSGCCLPVIHVCLFCARGYGQGKYVPIPLRITYS